MLIKSVKTKAPACGTEMPVPNLKCCKSILRRATVNQRNPLRHDKFAKGMLAPTTLHCQFANAGLGFRANDKRTSNGHNGSTGTPS